MITMMIEDEKNGIEINGTIEDIMKEDLTRTNMITEGKHFFQLSRHNIPKSKYNLFFLNNIFLRSRSRSPSPYGRYRERGRRSRSPERSRSGDAASTVWSAGASRVVVLRRIPPRIEEKDVN